MNEYLNIVLLKYQSTKKCECCDRVRDIFYRIDVKDHEDSSLIVGDLDLCKQCGDNFNKILGGRLNLGEKLIKEFSFD